MLLSHSYLLSTYYVSGTILSTGDIAMTEKFLLPRLWGPYNLGWGLDQSWEGVVVGHGHCKSSSLGIP